MVRSRSFLRAGVLALLGGVFTLLMAWDMGQVPLASAHEPHDEALRGGGGGLPGGTNGYFRGSGVCAGCHGEDPAGVASVDEDGNDVNVADDWRSSMMANSAKDPFWRAKVSHEVMVNPAHQVALEDKCTSCHAPQGRHNKHLQGLGPYSIMEMEGDPIALDGVSCVVCHRQSADSLGKLFSGDVRFTLGDTLWGPYSNPFEAPMQLSTAFTPAHSDHINSAGLCAGCHSLVTQTADLAGNLTGDHFVEQATYHEWLNSAFNNEVDSVNGITCQGCHVPRINDPIVLSTNYLFLSGRTPFGLHHFAGGNTFMLNMFKDYTDELGITATDEMLDSTIARTMRNLQHHSLLLDVAVADRDADTAWIDVRLENLTGHKFPSGYPSRRAWVQLAVLDLVTGDTLFMSGALDPSTYEIVDHPTDFALHFDMITAGAQTQIYEMVMGDVNDDKTTVLERAKSKLKDNRLPPLGFTTAHASYDTMYIAGVPASDTDFNHDGLGTEGSASDIVHYHVPMNGFTGGISIAARVWYQSVPPLWNQEMFDMSSAAIDSFRTMYEAADNSPVLVQEETITDFSVAIDDLAELGARVHPNPVIDGWLNITGLGGSVERIEVYDSEGKLVRTANTTRQETSRIRMPEDPATYMVVLRTRDRSFVTRVVVLN